MLGGVHPTYCPEEALRFSDAIVCGEAEDLWPQVVADFLAGSMKRMYKMEHGSPRSTITSAHARTAPSGCLHDPAMRFHDARLPFRL